MISRKIRPLLGLSLLIGFALTLSSPHLKSAPSVQWKVSEHWAPEEGGLLSGHWSLQEDPLHSLMVLEHPDSKLWDLASAENLERIVSDLTKGAETANTIAGIRDWKYTHKHLENGPRWKTLTLTASYLDINGRPFTAKEKYLIGQRTMAVMTLTFPSEDQRWKTQSPLDHFSPSEEGQQ